MKQLSFAITLVLGFLLVSCFGGKPEFKDQKMAGTIKGEAFELKTGSFKLKGDTLISYSMYGEDVADENCGFADTKIKIMGSIKNEAGVYSFGLLAGQTATVVIKGEEAPQNIIIVDGGIEVVKVADGKFEGKIDIKAKDIALNGTFSLDECKK